MTKCKGCNVRVASVDGYCLLCYEKEMAAAKKKEKEESHYSHADEAYDNWCSGGLG